MMFLQAHFQQRKSVKRMITVTLQDMFLTDLSTSQCSTVRTEAFLTQRISFLQEEMLVHGAMRMVTVLTDSCLQQLILMVRSHMQYLQEDTTQEHALQLTM